MMELPKRKRNRIQGFDYSGSGAYFITMCTDKRKNLFWNNVGANCVRQKNDLLSELGQIVENEIKRWNELYDHVCIKKYVIMPNHIHLIIEINADEYGRTQFAPTISRMIKQFKGIITKKTGFPIWQKSFHDHVIRNENDYWEIWRYIDSNPQKWQEDCFYTPNL